MSNIYKANLSRWRGLSDVQQEIMDWMNENTSGWHIENSNSELEYHSFYVFFKRESDLLMFNLAWKGCDA